MTDMGKYGVIRNTLIYWFSAADQINELPVMSAILNLSLDN